MVLPILPHRLRWNRLIKALIHIGRIKHLIIELIHNRYSSLYFPIFTYYIMLCIRRLYFFRNLAQIIYLLSFFFELVTYLFNLSFHCYIYFSLIAKGLTQNIPASVPFSSIPAFRGSAVQSASAGLRALQKWRNHLEVF